MNTRKRIGILTSGGDCPGLNAVIRAVVKCANRRGWDVFGIPYGTDGFISVTEGHYKPDDLRLQEHGYNIPGILQGLDVLQFLSGSILGSLSKGNPQQPEVAAKILEGYQRLGLDALVAIGGDGSLDIIYELAKQGGWNIIGIPKTIDNDVPFTEQSVGFGTAVETVTNALYDLTFTAASHDRVMVVQVMGRNAGHLALYSGIAGGADVILIPELVPQLTSTVVTQICEKVAEMRRAGRKFALVVVAEGVGGENGEKDRCIGDTLAQLIHDRSRTLCLTGDQIYCDLDQVETRASVLGHIQRSGIPTSFDRLLASAFGKKAVDLIAEGRFSRLVIWRAGQVQSEPLDQVLQVVRRCHEQGICPSPVERDHTMLQVAQSLGVYVGDLDSAAPPMLHETHSIRETMVHRS
ncbi:ATP-dependent 6-phosphofructokinase [Pseudanabaena sp. FACHB-2040]|uniref:ATP-dependent 6-phosphofructokinase n=1 Tax=Pseudanabaena sp. FACHB-2040 TaxID=2692859 RepID=UPI001685BBD5|nr:ATP-dependent 6-phosphofructokinase [Pseudanabaena sp. FACHB-2040]MBD2256474.1 6-phosphofructokinase [Pseudanabaena sp. FACHB-2040]